MICKTYWVSFSTQIKQNFSSTNHIYYWKKMRIAQQKRKENIAEYILYLYQVENLIRAFQLDMGMINEHLIKKYDAEEEEAKNISEWYRNLTLMMEKEGKQEKGHLQFLSNLLNELNEFHLRLLQSKTDQTYVQIYQAVTGLIAELKLKNPDAISEVQVAIDGVYGYLLLKIKQQDISSQTQEALKRLSQWLSYLSQRFKEYESGNVEF